jgi:glycosyltransferase involved in cell wall biosynthesis
LNILLICDARLPVFAYGGTERVVWDLANALSAMGHQVRLLAAAGTACPFAEVLSIDPRHSLKCQIPDDIDIVHFHNRPDFDPDIDFFPYVYTQHGNEISSRPMPLNTVFVSANHAHRFGSDQYVRNGLDWAPYGAPDFSRSRKWVHFLGNAAWKVKNLRGLCKLRAMPERFSQSLEGIDLTSSAASGSRCHHASSFSVWSAGRRRSTC